KVVGNNLSSQLDLERLESAIKLDENDVLLDGVSADGGGDDILDVVDGNKVVG
ncbi:unnamed protein product, partial [Rotaria magnacalcarata]